MAQVLGDPVDASLDFQKMENTYFIGSKVVDFNSATGQGTLQWTVRQEHHALLQQDGSYLRTRSLNRISRHRIRSGSDVALFCYFRQPAHRQAEIQHTRGATQRRLIFDACRSRSER